MASVLLLLLISIPTAFSHSILQLPRHVTAAADDDSLYCDSWRFSVETNDAGAWSRIPSRCVSFVQDYMTGGRYASDSAFVANLSLAFAGKVRLAGDGKDAWVFDIDETLLSNLPYYQDHGFGSVTFDEVSFDEWVDLGEAPAIPAILNLYNGLHWLGFKIFLLTGRSEFQRNATVKNLVYSGYSDWERLLLRGPSDKGTLATEFKSKKRAELINEGYRIHGAWETNGVTCRGLQSRNDPLNFQTQCTTSRKLALYVLLYFLFTMFSLENALYDNNVSATFFQLPCLTECKSVNPIRIFLFSHSASSKNHFAIYIIYFFARYQNHLRQS